MNEEKKLPRYGRKREEGVWREESRLLFVYIYTMQMQMQMQCGIGTRRKEIQFQFGERD